ncbi:molecular chaperone [Limnobaculum zhutongyuii]|uniref:Molecular chaperone n=2 Tax=Limnobaculum zhutongyuii TaxID=2498113 RepID=A0A411WH25_9GAMM|nr:molecular chaperone [Limnobaculum zhutongyuii]TQS88709.1 molecular chaperone [Limnobaculum zhutongyuii]
MYWLKCNNMMVKRMKRYGLTLLLCMGFISGLAPANAGIMPASTRIIYQEGTTEQSLMLANTNPYPVMVQTWIDNGAIDGTPEKADAPYIALPAVFRMQPNTMQGLRIIYNQRPLPKDRESVFWLNLYEVPPTKSERSSPSSKVKMTMNTQMKIFYRPKSLKEKPQNWAENMQFSLFRRGDMLVVRCTNPTPYFASFASLKLDISGKQYASEQKLDMMTPPFERAEYEFKHPAMRNVSGTVNLQFQLIDDNGFNQAGSQTVTVNTVER